MEFEFKDLCKTFYETLFAIVAVIVVAAVTSVAVVASIVGVLVSVGLAIAMCLALAAIALVASVVLVPCWGVVKIFEQPGMIIHAWRRNVHIKSEAQMYMDIHDKVEEVYNEKVKANDEGANS